MASLFNKDISRATLLAIVCLAALLFASFAASFHNHDSGQDATCLLCHVSERANVVAIASDAGKPLNTSSQFLIVPSQRVIIFDARELTRTPRAPPPSLLSL